MSLASLEREIVGDAKRLLNNPKLKLADVLEWSSSKSTVERNLEPNDMMIEIPSLKLWAAFPKTTDRREVKP